MSIAISNLSKRFGRQQAVTNLSFSVKAGEILGLLGPNGAGKSTTIRMLTGYLRPSAGQVSICGYNMCSAPRQAKAHLGYLPEQNPLYLDMYVRAYLHFTGRIHGLHGQQCLASVDQVIDQCGLTSVQHRKLGKLSKGYRQRVGFASALVHNPKVLILDEPTSGLDPNQLHEIRALIRTLRREKAIIFSTHMMQEVEVLCDRVIILHQGQLRIAGSLTEMASGGQFVAVSQTPITPAGLEALSGVASVQRINEYTCMIGLIKGGIDDVLLPVAEKHGLKLEKIAKIRQVLERIFQEVTTG